MTNKLIKVSKVRNGLLDQCLAVNFALRLLLASHDTEKNNNANAIIAITKELREVKIVMKIS